MAQFDESKAKDILDNYIDKAKKLFEGENKDGFLESLTGEDGKIKELSKQVKELPVLVEMTKAYLNKEYDQVPYKSMLSVTGALMYLLTKKDILPDNVPVIGQLDDIAVLVLAVKLCNKDIEAYKTWKLAKADEQPAEVIDVEPEAEVEAPADNFEA